MSKSSSGFVIIRRRPSRRPIWWAAIVLAWALSLATAWTWAGYHAAPQLPLLSESLEAAQSRLKKTLAHLESLQQRQTTLARADQISRAANREVQRELAARDDEIADLRANLAFYERLAGATGQPEGLKVHSARFSAEAGGTWRYAIVLTQSLNRSAVSLGQLQFAVEGVRDGRLATIDWDTLHQREAAPAQAYSFRYFQQLTGSVMLPADFTPQRVRVSLRGNNASLDQAVAWEQPSKHPRT